MEEFWRAYPAWININGKEVSARSIGIEVVTKIYPAAIKNDIVLHKTIINLLDNYRKHNRYAEMGIEKFVHSRHWELLAEKYGNNDKDDIAYGHNEF